MRLRLVTALALLLAAVTAMESPPSRRSIPNAPAGATLKKEESTVVEGSGDPPKAGTVDTDARKSAGYSPDDEDAVEGSGAPPQQTTSPSKNDGPAPPAVVSGGGSGAPPAKPQPPAPPPAPPRDSDDESVEGSGDEKDDGGTPFTPASITTTTTTTASPAVVPPSGAGGAGGAAAPPPKTMWETVAVTETPVVTTRGPVYEQPKTTPSSRDKERSTERSPTRPNTTEQPALFPFHSMLKPGIFAAVVGGTVVGLLMAILLVMFIVYRMRKRDEGSYALEEPKQRPYAGYAYTKASSTKEFYA